MKLYAISDLHLGHSVNRAALDAVAPHPDDWLILGGDIGETSAHLELAFRTLGPRFAKLFWVPGNHELWTVPSQKDGARGEAKYLELVALCRRYGVVCPEDEYPLWTGPGGPLRIAPLFLLYDYSFRPRDVPRERAVEWAMESGIMCADEHYLHPDPYPTRTAWCEARVAGAERRLAEASAEHPLVIINHFPLRADLVRLPFIPRFSIWCGTDRTTDWHVRFRARVVVSGHLHIRSTRQIDGVRFEEVSLGYPRQWQPTRGIDAYMREILPGPPAL